MSGRWKSWCLLGSLLSLGVSFMGCGGGDSPADQGPQDSGRDTGTDEDGAVMCQGDTSATMILACDRADLFMSVVNMAAGTVTLTNPTDTDIDLEREMRRMEEKIEEMKKQIYLNLTAWERDTTLDC